MQSSARASHRALDRMLQPLRLEQKKGGRRASASGGGDEPSWGGAEVEARRLSRVSVRMRV
mgnify:CR=1 FL=1